MKKRPILISLLVLTTTGAFSGTMGEIEPNCDFSGLYLGLGTGLINTFTKDSFSTFRSDLVVGAGNIGTNRFTNTGVLFTGNVGYGLMFKEKTYLGLKGAIYYTPIDNSVDTSFSSASGNNLVVGHNTAVRSFEPIYNIDAVLGYEVLPNFLPFVEGGVSFANAKNHFYIKRTRTNIVTNSNVEYTTALNLDQYKTGFNVGTGVNYLVNKNWYIFTEALYSYLGKNVGNTNIQIPGTSAIETQTRKETTQAVSLSVGFSYLFSNVG